MSRPMITGKKVSRERYEFCNIGIFDILAYRLPIPGWVSILHRISGAKMFLWLWLPLYLWDTSLSSPEGFLSVRALFAHPLGKVCLIFAIWGFLHHLFAGIRYLLIDVHVGVNKKHATHSSYLVLGLGALVTVVIAIKWVI